MTPVEQLCAALERVVRARLTGVGLNQAIEEAVMLGARLLGDERAQALAEP